MSKYSMMPAISISKENLKLLEDNLEIDQIGKVMIAIYHYIYMGETPEGFNKSEMATFNNIIAYVEGMGNKWLNKTSNFRNNNPRKKEEQEQEPSIEVDDDITNRFIKENKSDLTNLFDTYFADCDADLIKEGKNKLIALCKDYGAELDTANYVLKVMTEKIKRKNKNAV